jgi:hypothetical protein
MTTIPSTYAHSDAPRTVSVASLRKVWAIVTLMPCAATYNIGALAGIRSVAEVGAALRVLRDMGYVEFEDRTARARRVVVPMWMAINREV